MSDFSTIHGINLPVKNGEWSRKPQRIGNMRERTNGGRLRDGRIAIKEKWTGTTPLLTPAEAAPLIGLLNAAGQVFSFDSDVYSSKGLLWVATEPARDLTNKKFGAASGSFVSGVTCSINPGFNGLDQTLLIWRRPGSGSFDHYGITRTSAGTIAEVKNGVPGAFTTSNWLTFGASQISLLGKNDAGTNTTVQGDDLVILPFLLTPAQIAAVFAQTTAWADLPELHVSGDGHGGDFVVMSEITNETYSQGVVGGVWFDNLVEIEFTLDEV